MATKDEIGGATQTGQAQQVCAEKTALLNAYEEAVAVVSEALTSLRSAMGVLSRDEYDRAYLRTEELRVIARQKHEALMAHAITHRC
ncbi:MAG TPA: hypothetical protein VKY31_07730 [Terriglobia bacterium]|nr:hypothetical protein [Terriglobia bacterium]